MAVVDVRSEGEYGKGHIPQAINFPLLNNEERHLVGLCYKEKDQAAAVQLGFRLTGYKFADYLKGLEIRIPSKRVLLYCWRGGLRSNIMAWLLSTGGWEVTVWEGGYKSWRALCLHTITSPIKLLVLTGKTGSGKTELLDALEQRGEPVVNLERLAYHRGSAFGGLGLPEQPTQEHFENNLCDSLMEAAHRGYAWAEDESRPIGRLRVPEAVFDNLQSGSRIEISRPYERRLERILNDHSVFSNEVLAEKTLQLRKRMGYDTNALAVKALVDDNDRRMWLNVVLSYYDKAYGHNSESGEDSKHMEVINWDGEGLETIVGKLMQWKK
jgi:tRNA 2-selenouridine synthase